MKLFCGVDPGLFGAVAALDETGYLIFAEDTPVIAVKRGRTPKGNVKTRHLYLPTAMADVLTENLLKDVERPDAVIVGIEAVHSMPRQGVHAMFEMGRGLGLWQGIVAALRLPLEMVDPVRWKREMGIPAGSDKRASVELALRLFPRAPIKRTQDGRADSVLIAEWLRRKHMGSMSGTTSGRAKT
jgi:crossover junction endodeoxyribonuclease RuvC